MLVRDLVHRLRVRANNAAAAGEPHLAADLRAAIDAMIRMDRELQLTRSQQQDAKVADAP